MATLSAMPTATRQRRRLNNMAYGERRGTLQLQTLEKAKAVTGKIQDTGTQLSWDEADVYEKVGNICFIP